ncbi:MAG: hypothetical protein JSU94_06130 [Phycisphaerales bacterium]|nr:MAG: hypothetical protein JSU94_06130 [Phycisphaerales bacterium]
MKREIRKFRCLLGASIVLVILAAQTATAEYIRIDGGDSYDDGYMTQYHGSWGYELAVAESSGGDCEAEAAVHYENWIQNDANESHALSDCWYATAMAISIWTWDGPPGDAPGGTLDWSQSASGVAQVEGAVAITQGGSAASASARADVFASVRPDYANHFIWVDGSTEAPGSETTTYATGGTWPVEPDWLYTSEDPQEDEFEAWALWGMSCGDSETFPAGTVTVYIQGLIACHGCADTEVIWGPGNWAEGCGIAQGEVSYSATFSPP